MTNPGELRGFFKPAPGIRGVYKPFVRVEFTTEAGTSREVDAIFDTGCFGILVELETAAEFLMISEADIIRSFPRQEIRGVGSPRQFGYECRATLRLRATTGSSESVTWNDTLFYAYKGVPYGVLIGQKNGLQERAFIHLNYSDRHGRRCWKLHPQLPSILSRVITRI